MSVFILGKNKIVTLSVYQREQNCFPFLLLIQQNIVSIFNMDALKQIHYDRMETSTHLRRQKGAV